MRTTPVALPTLLFLTLSCSNERQDVGNGDVVAPGEPAYRFARVDSEKNIWVCKPRRPDTSRRWSVFDVNAQLIAVIETPLRFDLHEIVPERLDRHISFQPRVPGCMNLSKSTAAEFVLEFEVGP